MAFLVSSFRGDPKSSIAILHVSVSFIELARYIIGVYKFFDAPGVFQKYGNSIKFILRNSAMKKIHITYLQCCLNYTGFISQ